MTYPDVRDEFETIKKVAKGYSLARFGDGELKMSLGQGYRRQSGSQKLADELSRVLTSPNERCIVGIPTMHPDGPKIGNWLRHRDRFLSVISQDMRYYSAFVSRPDSAPWINTRKYARSVVSLWSQKKVAVLCERKGSMFRAVRPAALKAIHVECPRFGAYDMIDELESRILATEPDIAILSCGPSATCLADRLSRRGLHSVDLGSIGQFICRTMYG